MAKNAMKNRPIKFRIIELLADGEERWSNEMIDILAAEYGMSSTYGRNCLNFDLVEVSTSGFIEGIDEAIDTDGSKIGKNRLLMKYRITGLGRSEYEWLLGSAGKKEAKA
ncbi:MAG: hypothetical protein PHI87_06370 [Candidatus Methanomethylophilus sp.]|nr:hypothetical protein [Methanomethylophilus sp.]MDD4669259.1 hypothetical protein [Methanomethylophilus sp.]